MTDLTNLMPYHKSTQTQPTKEDKVMSLIDAGTALGRDMHGLSPIGTLPLDLHQQSAVKRTSGTHDGDTAGSMDSRELEVEG